MKETSSASSRTPDQERALRRMAQDLADKAVTVMLDKVNPNKEGLQRMLGKGDVWGPALTGTFVAQATMLCDLPLRYLKSVPVVEIKELVVTKELLRERFNIGYWGDNATRLLMAKTLPGAKAQALAVHRLEKRQTGQQLKNELGVSGLDIVASMLALVEQQKNGPASPEDILFTNGYANLAIVESEGVSWAFFFHWHSGSGCWRVEADPLVSVWFDGYQVFSRDC